MQKVLQYVLHLLKKISQNERFWRYQGDIGVVILLAIWLVYWPSPNSI